MKCGISSACFYPEYTETAMRHLAENGVKRIELFLNTYREMSPPYIKQFQEILNAYAMQAVSVHPFTSGMEPILFFSDYERRFYDGIEEYKKYFAFMQQVGAQIFVFHGNKRESPFPDERYFERFALLREAGRREGIIVAQENVIRCKSYTLDFLAQMKRQLNGNVDFVLDIKQAVRSGQDVFAMVEEIGDCIRHIHISDHREGAACLPVGKGSFDFVRFFQAVCEKGFDGTAMLELYRSNYGEYSELYDSLHCLEKLVQTSKTNGKI